MATPTLTMIPSGYKAQKVYSVLPINGDGDFTFDRTTTATRVNKNGLIEQVSTNVPRLDYPINFNLAGYSEDFSRGWSRYNSTVITNQTTSPSGDLTADKFISDDTNQPRVEGQFTLPTTDTTYTFSVFVKKINTRYIGLARFSGGQGAIFDLDTKSVVHLSAENASIKEFSNGWFRISITQTVLSTDSFNYWKINGTNGSSIGTGVVGDETFIWGAQLEEQSYVTPYIPTPRGGCPSLLLEPYSLNLVIGSAEGNYSHLPASLTNTISPDGTNNAVIPTPQYTWIRHQEIIPAGTYSNGQKLTYSWYRKRISTPTGTSVNGDLNIRGLINLTSLESNNATQIESNINGFDRFQVVVEIINGSLESEFRAYIGDVVGVGNSSVAYFGHQFEALPYTTSYIPTPTTGIASRSAETFSNDFSSQPTVANTNTVVLKFIPMGFSNDWYELLRFSDGTNQIALEGFQTNKYNVYGNGLTTSGMVDGALSLDVGSINTISFSYNGTSLRFSHNGSTISINTTTGNLPTITEVSHSVGGLSPIKILDLRVYNDFKTQEELNTLTTITL